jgi:DNA-binding SARP family transcriptional activator
MTGARTASLVTFGGLAIRNDCGLADTHVQPRRLALVALLAASGEQGVSREKILACLWPGMDGAPARSALSQAIYALRRDLRCEDLLLGSSTLRLNPSALPSDVARFRAALAAGRLAEAATAYTGPFLDGFFLNDAPEFERWAECERAQLFGECAAAVEQLATRAAAAQDSPASIAWWTRRAAMDPTDGRIVASCMCALEACGDVQGAIRQLRAHEAAMQELCLPVDPAVRRLAARMRTEPRSTAPSHPSRVSAAPPTFPVALDPPARRVRPLHPTAGLRIGLGASLLAAVAALWLTVPTHPATPAEGMVLAVGEIEGAPAVAELLATRLARVPGLEVISTARLHELLEQSAWQRGTSAWFTAARESGAEQLIDGSLVRVESGQVRLELRRINLATGTVMHTIRVEGKELGKLVEESASELQEGIAAGTGRRLR